MANYVVIFPKDRKAAAIAYQTFANNNSPFHPEPYAYIRADINGDWIVPYLGPPFKWDRDEIREKVAAIAMRVLGTISAKVHWPEDDA